MSRYVRSTSKNTTLLLNFPYILPHGCTSNRILSGRRRGRRRRGLGWSYLQCSQSIRGRFSRLTLRQRELSTISNVNRKYGYTIDPYQFR